MSKIKVIKSSGVIEPFSEEKLMHSLKAAGVDNVLSRWVTEKIKQKIKGTISTQFIHNKALEILQSEKAVFAMRYKLKAAIMELGPTGHPFEKLVGWILRAMGYDAKTNVLIQGKCVRHEVDVIGEKDGKRIMVEAKYHNERGIKSDVKVAMYVYARFLDINFVEKLDEGWLITNTKLTSDAKQYASCVGLKAIGWNYPAGENLQRLIEVNHLFPLTVLETLSFENKRKLLDAGLVLAKEITGDKLNQLPIKNQVKEKIQAEIQALMEVKI